VLRIGVDSVIQVHEFDADGEGVDAFSILNISAYAGMPGAIEGADLLHDAAVFADREVGTNLAALAEEMGDGSFERGFDGGVEDDGVDDGIRGAGIKVRALQIN